MSIQIGGYLPLGSVFNRGSNNDSYGLPGAATRSTISWRAAKRRARFSRITINVVAMVVLSLPMATFAGTTTMRGVMSPTQFNASDFQALGQYHANLIRWQIMRNWGRSNTERDLDDYNSWLAGKLNELDQVLAAAEANGLKVVIDLHTPPGGRYADKSMAMFYEQVYNDRFIQIWQEIATRYKGTPAVWAYDLVNEPTQNRTTPPAGMDSRSTQIKAAQAIRVIDPTTPVIIQPHGILHYGTSADSYKGFTPVTGISNIWYEVHLYNFLPELLNGKTCYPGQAGGLNWNKNLLRAIMHSAWDFQSKYHLKMYVGEFSVPVGSCGAKQFLSDYIDLFEEYGWDWTYHAFREAPMWDMEAPDRKDLLLSWFAKNTPRTVRH
ncbi:MAG: glycoside hydrolase family 5 protein [Methylocella sp.]